MVKIFRIPTLIFLSCILVINVYGQAPVTVASLLNEMIDPAAVASLPQQPFRLQQASSYDRRSVSPDSAGWGANADQGQYIRTEEVEGRKELVMMDAGGPGAIVRFWLTTFKRNGTIRIYFDNSKTPELVIPAYDLMKSGLPLGKALLNPHSSYQKVEKGGSTLYLPLPFAKHCKVTFEDKDIEPKQPRYYQINYRVYAPGTKVATFTKAQLNPLKTLLAKVDAQLWSPPKRTGKQAHATKQLVAGGSLSMSLPKGNNSIRQLVIAEVTNDCEWKQLSGPPINEVLFRKICERIEDHYA